VFPYPGFYDAELLSRIVAQSMKDGARTTYRDLGSLNLSSIEPLDKSPLLISDRVSESAFEVDYNTLDTADNNPSVRRCPSLKTLLLPVLIPASPSSDM
jgi:hypothetical protein